MIKMKPLLFLFIVIFYLKTSYNAQMINCQPNRNDFKKNQNEKVLKEQGKGILKISQNSSIFGTGFTNFVDIRHLE